MKKKEWRIQISERKHQQNFIIDGFISADAVAIWTKVTLSAK